MRTQMSTGYLVFYSPVGIPSVIEVKNGDVVGRDPAQCNIVVTGELADERVLLTVSRRHARFVLLPEEQVFVVSDQATANGTYVNGQRAGINILKSGWHVSFGALGGTFFDSLGEVRRFLESTQGRVAA